MGSPGGPEGKPQLKLSEVDLGLPRAPPPENPSSPPVPLRSSQSPAPTLATFFWLPPLKSVPGILSYLLPCLNLWVFVLFFPTLSPSCSPTLACLPLGPMPVSSRDSLGVTLVRQPAAPQFCSLTSHSILRIDLRHPPWTSTLSAASFPLWGSAG